jgi:glyoxylase-like metal-dependent hydrolase (beta-lactamase superfamily II)
MQEDLLQIRSLGVNFYVLRDAKGLYLIDGGFVGGRCLLRRALKSLTVIHLPGHTAGHSGFYCERSKLLFCSDLFASYGHFSHLPPRIFNSDGAEIPKSVSKALGLDLTGVLPNHGDASPPEVRLKRLIAINRHNQAASQAPS